MSTYVFILFFLLLGKLLQQYWTVPERLPQQLNRFVINVAFPAIIFLKIPELVIDARILFPVASPWICLLASAALSICFCRYFGWSRETEVNLLILTGLGNTGFLGFPMAKAFFPGEALPYALIYDQLGTFIALTTYAAVLIAIYSGGPRVDVGKLLWKIFSFPPFIALMVALWLPSGLYPEYIKQVLEWLGLTIIPLTMLSVGMQFKVRIDPDIRLPLTVALLIKLVLLPTIIWLLARGMRIDLMVANISIFLAAMPSMITGAVLLIGSNLAPRLAVAILGFGILISLATVPIWYWLIS